MSIQQATQESQRIDARSYQLRAETLDMEARSVEAVLSTEGRVETFDWRRGEMIEEVLLADGVDLPRQVPLLNTHSRYSLSDVLGSVRDIRREAGQIVGRLFFAEGDDEAERAWNKVRQGHLTDVSVGYRISDYTDIEPGQRAAVNGMEYEAGKRRLRLATAWKLREVSSVPIGADQDAKLREYHEGNATTGEPTMAKNTAAQPQEQERTESDPKPQAQQTPPAAPQVDADKLRAEAIDAERKRIAGIRELAGDDVPAELVRKAESEGWDEARASREFLTAVREARKPSGAFAIHSSDSDARLTERSLSAGLLIGQGVDPTGLRIDAKDRQARSLRFAFTEQDADHGHEFRSLSAVDMIRECVRLDGGRVPRDMDELLRAAMSGTHFDRVFTTNVYAQLIAGWNEAPDTTAWCQSEDVPNFMTQEDITLRQNADLDKHPRGATAKHADFSDDYETYSVSRYSKQFVVDEQDVIDDRLMAMMQVPREMGMAARRLHPDLVYATLLANPTLTATTGALFNATAETTAGGHANLTTAALASAGLKAAITSMAKKRLDGVPLNIRPRFLIVPPDLDFTGRELLTSGEKRDTTASTEFMVRNVLASEGLTLVTESRIDATGVYDPDAKVTRTGSATNWFLAAERRTVKKLYLRGTNRSPQLRSRMLEGGQWGMGWDIKMDAGVGVVDYRGMHKSTGAG